MFGNNSNFSYYTGADQGGRPYMEDVISIVADVQLPSDLDSVITSVPTSYFAVFDGHGGSSAATFAEKMLLKEITKARGFWSNDDEEVKKAIEEGFLSTHQLMLAERDSWPTAINGEPSNSGTTASVIFLRNKKLYIAHVGDSTVVLGEKEAGKTEWSPKYITTDHKPNLDSELKRIERIGGSVMKKKGVHRVVWKRQKKIQPAGRPDGKPIFTTCFIPFLAMARSLGDLWSYSEEYREFLISPKPDIHVVDIKEDESQCLILASDGLWNVVNPNCATEIVNYIVRHTSASPATLLVDVALQKWTIRNMRADNVSVVVVVIGAKDGTRETDGVAVVDAPTNIVAANCSSGASDSASVKLPLTSSDVPSSAVPGATEHAVGADSRTLGAVVPIKKISCRRLSIDLLRCDHFGENSVNPTKRRASDTFLPLTDFNRPVKRPRHSFKFPITPEEKNAYWRKRRGFQLD